MDLGLWKPDDDKDKASLTSICVCRVSSCIFTERLLKIKKKIWGELVFKFGFGLGRGDFLKANKNHNPSGVKSYLYGGWISFLNQKSRILKECVLLPVKPNTVLPQISTEAGMDTSSSPKKKEKLLKNPPNPRKHTTIEQTGISQNKFK